LVRAEIERRRNMDSVLQIRRFKLEGKGLRGCAEGMYCLFPDAEKAVVRAEDHAVRLIKRREKASTLQQRTISELMDERDSLLEVCIVAHDALLSLHLCDLDKKHADGVRGTLRKAIDKVKGPA
jgi:hypothetical protein